MSVEKHGKLGFCDFLGILISWIGVGAIVYIVATLTKVTGGYVVFVAIVALIVAGTISERIIKK
ncbi:MAG: hypothetical protein ACNFW9_03525 [Candidatus Kerfeldbacteria bacterium]